jgi:hypothetical protein
MNKPIEQNIQEKATAYYRMARLGLPNGEPITLLHLSDEYTLAAFGCEADQPETIWQFSIGTGITSRKYFKHNPPTPAEIEEAIMIVEDEVMPLKRLLAPNSLLITFDKEIQTIALQTQAIPTDRGQMLSIGDMETVFNRLAAIITGRPASMDSLPSELSFAASLLILREFMHHLGFTAITIRKNTDDEV